MKVRYWPLGIVFAVGFGGVIACGETVRPAPTPDVEAIVEARLNQERAAMATAEATIAAVVVAQAIATRAALTPTTPSPVPTPTSIRTPSPVPTLSPTATLTAIPEPSSMPKPTASNTPTATPEPSPIPTSTPTPTHTPAEASRAFVEAGKEFLKLDPFSTRALASFDEAISADPENKEAYYLRGVTNLSWPRRAEAAISDLTQAILLDPKVADYWYQRGLAHIALGRQLIREDREHYAAYDRAVDDFSEAIRLSPNEPYYHYQRGIARGGSSEAWFGGEPNKWGELALADYSAAVRLDPRVAEFFVRRGRIHSYLDMNWEAISDYTEAIRMDPQDYANYEDRALVYLWMSDEEFELRHPNFERFGRQSQSHWEMAIDDQTAAIRVAPESKLADLYDWRAGIHQGWSWKLNGVECQGRWESVPAGRSKTVPGNAAV